MTETEPSFFSVVIPVYNGETFIANAIESCLKQTVLPKEIVVIDDASDDNTAEQVQSIKSALVKYYRNDINRGPSFSRNRGMQLASSSWILFLDADDIFHPEKISIISYFLEKNKMIRAIGHSFTIKGNTGSIPVTWKNFETKKISVNEILFRNPMVTPSLAVCTANNILFNDGMVYAEDHDFILRTAEIHGMYYLDIPLCTLQRTPLTPGGISSNKWKMRKGEMRMYLDYSKRHKKYLAVPFLLLFSLFKHIRGMLFSMNTLHEH